jgi:hypothetical protein
MVTFDQENVSCTSPITGEVETTIQVNNVRVNGVLAQAGFSFPSGLSAVVVRNMVERALGEAETDPSHADVLAALKLEKGEAFRTQFRDFIHSRYSPERQQTFALMRSEARLDGLANRAAYIGQGLGWIDYAFTHFYTQLAILDAAATRAAIDAVALDLAGLAAADPVITIFAARAIPD